MTDLLTIQSQITESVESVNLVASSIYGLLSSRSLPETAELLLQPNSVSDVSKKHLYALHKKLNCNDFLVLLERADENCLGSITLDFFNPITKHFGRSQFEPDNVTYNIMLKLAIKNKDTHWVEKLWKSS